MKLFAYEVTVGHFEVRVLAVSGDDAVLAAKEQVSLETDQGASLELSRLKCLFGFDVVSAAAKTAAVSEQ